MMMIVDAIHACDVVSRNTDGIVRDKVAQPRLGEATKIHRGSKHRMKDLVNLQGECYAIGKKTSRNIG